MVSLDLAFDPEATKMWGDLRDTIQNFKLTQFQMNYE